MGEVRAEPLSPEAIAAHHGPWVPMTLSRSRPILNDAPAQMDFLSLMWDVAHSRKRPPLVELPVFIPVRVIYSAGRGRAATLMLTRPLSPAEPSAEDQLEQLFPGPYSSLNRSLTFEIAPTFYRPRFVGLPPATTRSVVEAPATLGAELDPDGPAAGGSDPLAIADADHNIYIATSDDAPFRHLLLRGGRVQGQALTVRDHGARLELDGVQFGLAGAVQIVERGEVIVHVRARSAGLDLGSGVPLNVRDGRVTLYFHQSPEEEGIHWGLRAIGDRRDELRKLFETGGIVIALVRDGQQRPATPLLIFDGTYTYVTLDKPIADKPINSSVPPRAPDVRVPEPTLIALLVLGAPALLRRRR